MERAKSNNKKRQGRAVMKKVYLIVLVSLLVLLIGCCSTYSGYGRYTMQVDCEKVVIGGETYEIARHGNDLAIAGHTIQRGIYRKSRPWLYIHHINGDKVDVTFEEGSKAEYPLYTGVSASIFDVYSHPWEMTRSTNAGFPGNYWLISHWWTDTGISFDLQQRIGDVMEWRLVQGDIFVPRDGIEVEIAEINTKVKIISFNAEERTAIVEFTAQ